VPKTSEIPKIVERQLLFFDFHAFPEGQLIIRGFLIPKANNGEKRELLSCIVPKRSEIS
jgi:hypothetical protein